MERFKAAVGLFLVWVLPVFAQSVEPNAGKWKTWIISSGKDFRVPPPPDAGTTQAELAWIRDAVATPNPNIAGSVTFWSAGAPAYRWIELINNRALRAATLCLRGIGDVRRHHRHVGFQIRLQSSAAQRT